MMRQSPKPCNQEQSEEKPLSVPGAAIIRPTIRCVQSPRFSIPNNR